MRDVNVEEGERMGRPDVPSGNNIAVINCSNATFVQTRKLTVAALPSLDVNDFPHLEILLLPSIMRTMREKEGEE